MLQEWWGTRCLATVFLETRSTLPHAWSPQDYVRDNSLIVSQTLLRFSLVQPILFLFSFSALRIHVSQSTINTLQRTDRMFEYEQRGETYLKVLWVYFIFSSLWGNLNVVLGPHGGLNKYQKVPELSISLSLSLPSSFSLSRVKVKKWRTG